MPEEFDPEKETVDEKPFDPSVDNDADDGDDRADMSVLQDLLARSVTAAATPLKPSLSPKSPEFIKARTDAYNRARNQLCDTLGFDPFYDNPRVALTAHRLAHDLLVRQLVEGTKGLMIDAELPSVLFHELAAKDPEMADFRTLTKDINRERKLNPDKAKGTLPTQRKIWKLLKPDLTEMPKEEDE